MIDHSASPCSSGLQTSSLIFGCLVQQRECCLSNSTVCPSILCCQKFLLYCESINFSIFVISFKSFMYIYSFVYLILQVSIFPWFSLFSYTLKLLINDKTKYFLSFVYEFIYHFVCYIIIKHPIKIISRINAFHFPMILL